MYDLTLVICARTILDTIGPPTYYTMINRLGNIARSREEEESYEELSETTEDTDKTQNENLSSLMLTVCILNGHTTNPEP